MHSHLSLLHSCFRPACPCSPTPHTSINFVSSHAVPYQPHSDTKDLDVLVSAFIVEEKHLIVLDATIPMYPRKMRRFAARVYLHVIEVVDCATRRTRCAGYLEELEHLAAEIWGAGARCGADKDGFCLELLQISLLLLFTNA
jgi:uncharacterized glyoxalase superfamily protein PhnB